MTVILIVEDDRDNREALAEGVTILGYQIVVAESGEEALRTLEQRNDVALALCDIRLPGMGGSAFAAAARERHPSLKVAFLTGDPRAVDDAIANGAIAMIKPYDFNILTHVIVDALERPPER